MPWLKAGDTAAVHPVVMAALSVPMPPPETFDQFAAMNVAFGLALRCAIHSAALTTDYFVSDGVVLTFGGGNGPRWAEFAAKAGIWKRARKDGHRGWLLIEDPEFLHIRLAEEIAWERQQKADAANPGLIVPVRLRDGDGCRYCSAVVQWASRKGNRRGTYDHREPGIAATIDTLVVACGACNSARRDRADADDIRPLKPVPENPFYSPSTVAFLKRHGVDIPRTERPGLQPVHATAATPPAGGIPRPRTSRDVDAPAGSADSADPLPTERVGSGRVGSRDGPGSGSARKRSRRGRPRTTDPNDANPGRAASP